MRRTPEQRGNDTLACPHWCRREHQPDDHADDLLHQSISAFVAVVHGDSRFGHDDGLADTVVLRLVQRVGSPAVWLEAASEEGRSLHLLVSAESARRLAGAIAALLPTL